MISLKVGSLTGLSSKLWPWRSPFAKAGQTQAPAQTAARPARAAPQPVSRAVRARMRPSALRPKLVLASASPRRLGLLEQAGITPDALRPTTIDESVTKGEVPRHIVKRLARAKAEAAKKLIRGDKEFEKSFVLAADTVVAVGREEYLKTEFAGGDERTEQVLPGMSRDSVLATLGSSVPGATAESAMGADSLRNVWRRTQYLVDGVNIEVIWYSPSGEKWTAADTVPAERVIPVVLLDGKVAGVGVPQIPLEAVHPALRRERGPRVAEAARKAAARGAFCAWLTR